MMEDGIEEDFYSSVDRVLDDDEITAAEEGFISGYMSDGEEEEE